MNPHHKISPGIGLSDNQAMEIRYKSFAATKQTSVVCGGGGGGNIQQRTGEADNKQFQMMKAPRAYFPDDSEMIDNRQ
jgi:hypothetical protein